MNDNMIFNTNKGVTVREVCGLLKDARKLHLVENGGCVEFNHNNPLHMGAFGDFVVSGIFLHGETNEIGDAEYELEIAQAPVKRSSNDF